MIDLSSVQKNFTLKFLNAHITHYKFKNFQCPKFTGAGAPIKNIHFLNIENNIASMNQMVENRWTESLRTFEMYFCQLWSTISQVFNTLKLLEIALDYTFCKNKF